MAPGLHLVEKPRVHQVPGAKEGQGQRDDHGQERADQRDGQGLPGALDGVGHDLGGEVGREEALHVLGDGAAAVGAEEHAQVDLRTLVAPDEQRPQERQQRPGGRPGAVPGTRLEGCQLIGVGGGVVHNNDRTLALT